MYMFAKRFFDKMQRNVTRPKTALATSKTPKKCRKWP